MGNKYEFPIVWTISSKKLRHFFKYDLIRRGTTHAIMDLPWRAARVETRSPRGLRIKYRMTSPHQVCMKPLDFQNAFHFNTCRMSLNVKATGGEQMASRSWQSHEVIFSSNIYLFPLAKILFLGKIKGPLWQAAAERKMNSLSPWGSRYPSWVIHQVCSNSRRSTSPKRENTFIPDIPNTLLVSI